MTARTSIEVRILIVIVALSADLTLAAAQAPLDRTFPQSKAAIDKALKQLQTATSGRLPTLDGFVIARDRSLDRFERGYYQCAIQTTATSAGTVVRVSAKITAWYTDPDGTKSGYQILPSNGRVENDLLDSLGEILAKQPVQPAPQTASRPLSSAPTRKTDPVPAISAPMPRDSEPIVTTRNGSEPLAPSSSHTPGASSNGDLATQRAVTDRHSEELEKEAKNLEEILHNQAHPSNLAAVKKSGTPVLVSANAGAKVMFVASAEDEFEVLDKNAGWVHVRISGLSRGWIQRSSLEMPDDIAMAAVPAAKTPPPSHKDAVPFQVENEQVAIFPGDWTPLRGKTVEIVSVRKSDENASNEGTQAKLDFAKSVFDREYAELSKTSSNAAGVVVIFDSEDGGMMAATLPVLQTWKTGELSDEGFWHRCFFDPPELYSPAKPH